MTQKYPTLIRHHIYPRDAEANSFNSGWLSMAQIEEYIQEILSKKHVPIDSCVFSIEAEFNSTQRLKATLRHGQAFENYSHKETKGGLNVSFILKNGRKCDSYKCLDNICTGKCTDKFMIEVIGKKFFPQQYKDTNTKQK